MAVTISPPHRPNGSGTYFSTTGYRKGCATAPKSSPSRMQTGPPFWEGLAGRFQKRVLSARADHSKGKGKSRLLGRARKGEYHCTKLDPHRASCVFDCTDVCTNKRLFAAAIVPECTIYPVLSNPNIRQQPDHR